MGIIDRIKMPQKRTKIKIWEWKYGILLICLTGLDFCLSFLNYLFAEQLSDWLLMCLQ